MKTLHISLIITVSVTALAIIIAIFASLFPQNQVPVYEYVIHESYQGADKNGGTVTIQNTTFHVTNLDLAFDNQSRPEWLEMYDVNFSFPNGIELQNTPGGQIMESYVTFPDNPVPYRLAVGFGASPNTPNYDYTTVLSTHKEPQAGFTIHNGIIQLLVNWSKIHSSMDISGLNDTYNLGQPIDFQVNVSGFDYFDAGETPDINITKADGTIVWQNPHYLVMCCPAEFIDYNKTFDLTQLGGPILVNQSGTYFVHVDYDWNSTEKKFDVVQISDMSQFEKNIPVMINGTKSDFSFNYTITGGQIKQAKADIPNKALILSVTTIKNGTLIADLPRALIDAKMNGQDSSFIVLENGRQVLYNQTTAYQDRLLSIPFQYGISQIEIIAPVQIQ